MKSIIIGGGIGGLTLANAFQQNNIPFELFEAASEFREVGAGIMLGTNAMQIFQHLGLAESIYQKGLVLQAANITDENGKMISGMPLDKMEAKYGVKTVIIHRAALIEVLKSSLNEGNLHLSKAAQKVYDIDQQPIVQFSDGSTASGDFIVGADGIHSNLRYQLFSDREKRYLDQTCWRGVVDFQLPKPYQKCLTECWGKTGRFAFVAINNRQVYWYAVQKTNQGQKDDPQTVVQKLQNLFAHFEGPVAQILAQTKPQNILRNDIFDLKPQRIWSKEKVVFLGDAIHATSPNLGQGGAQAIEDAHALAYFISHGKNLPEAFQAYEKYRFPKAKFVVDQSKRFGAMAHREEAWYRSLRNFMLRSIPNGLFIKQMEKIHKIKKELLVTH